MSKPTTRKRNGAYQRAMKYCKEKNHYTCGICGKNYTNDPERTMLLEADHIKPIREGGARLDQKNLWALCGRLTVSKCHQKRHLENGTNVRGQ